MSSQHSYSSVVSSIAAPIIKNHIVDQQLIDKPSASRNGVLFNPFVCAQVLWNFLVWAFSEQKVGFLKTGGGLGISFQEHRRHRAHICTEAQYKARRRWEPFGV